MITERNYAGQHDPTADDEAMRLDHFEQRIEIVITPYGEQVRAGARIDYYERKVLFGGKVVYCDTLDWQKALTQRDPLSEFHNWLNNTGRYSRKVSPRRKYALRRRLVSGFQSLSLRFQLLALRLKRFYLQKKILLIKSLH